MVGWVSGAALVYVETLPDGFWSERRSLDLVQISLGDALEALARRLARP